MTLVSHKIQETVKPPTFYLCWLMTGKMFAEIWLNMYSITSSVFFTLCLPVAAYLLYKLLLPAVRERKIGRKLLQEIDGPPPHWLFGHLNVVNCCCSLAFCQWFLYSCDFVLSWWYQWCTVSESCFFLSAETKPGSNYGDMQKMQRVSKDRTCLVWTILVICYASPPTCLKTSSFYFW